MATQRESARRSASVLMGMGLLGLGSAALAAAAGFAVARFGPLPLAAVLAVGGALALATWLPEFPLVVLLMGMPLWLLLPESLQGLTGGLAIPLTLLAAILSLAWHRLLRRQSVWRWPKPRAEEAWLLGFIVWMGLSLLWSANTAYGAQKLLGFAAFAAGGYFIFRWGYQPSHLRFERLVWLIALAGCVHAGLLVFIAAQTGVWLPYEGLSYRYWYVQTVVGLDRIAESVVLLYGVLAVWWLLRHPARRWNVRRRVLLWGALLLQLWAVLSYQQRSATVALALTAFCLLVYRPGVRNPLSMLLSKRFLLFAIPGLVGLALMVYGLNREWNVSALADDIDVLARLAFYNAALDVVAEQPVFGVGIGGMAGPDRTIWVNGRPFNEWSEGPGLRRFYVHNRILEVASELGLVGLALLLGFTGAVLWRFYRLVRSGYVLAAYMAFFGVVAFLQQWVVAMFSTDLMTWNIGIWAAVVVVMFDWRKAIG